MQQLCPQTGPRLTAAGFRHGFFGRVGGPSRGAYSSLNCSYSVEDEADNVTLNLTRIANYFGLPTERLATVCQVHGCEVVNADEALDLSALRERQADALFATRDDCALSVRTADCIPILVGCRATGAAAAIHAGWRGIVARVVPKAISHLLSKGARPDALIVGIGPHIRAAAFEVSVDVAAALEASSPGSGAVDANMGTRPHVHLGRLVLAQLEELGIYSDQVDDLGSCTFTNQQEYFSYRRDGRISGRQLSSICPLPR